MFEVRTSYDFANFPAMDDVLYAATGRVSDFSGSDFSGRDHGWVCKSEIEAERIARALRKIGQRVEIRSQRLGVDVVQTDTCTKIGSVVFQNDPTSQ